MEEKSLAERKFVVKGKLAKLGIILTLAVLLTVGLFAGYKIGEWMSRDKSVLEVDDVREELVPVARLATYEYNFTEVLHLSDAHRVLNFDIPFTDKHYVATVEGSVLVGLEDAELVECGLEKDAEGFVKAVKVKLPHCSAWNASIDHESLNVLVDLKGVANTVNKEELNDLYIATEERQEAKAETEGVLEKADERLKELLTAHIRALYGEWVDVSYEYFE